MAAGINDIYVGMKVRVMIQTQNQRLGSRRAGKDIINATVTEVKPEDEMFTCCFEGCKYHHTYSAKDIGRSVCINSEQEEDAWAAADPRLRD